MKKSILFLTVAAGLLMAVTTSRLLAVDTASKEVTITGKALCTKCALHETSECQTAIQTEVAGKKVTYYLTPNDTAMAFHKNICSTPEQVTATGTVSEKDGKEMLTVSKIEPVKP
jgi:hypothetical protein